MSYDDGLCLENWTPVLSWSLALLRRGRAPSLFNYFAAFSFHDDYPWKSSSLPSQCCFSFSQLLSLPNAFLLSDDVEASIDGQS